MENDLFTEKIVEYYIDNNSSFNDNEDKIRLKDKFMDDIKQEVVFLERERLQKEIRDIQMKEEEKSRLRQIKVLMYEGFFIAFLVGLIVNQATDVINITKGSKISIGITLLWILALGLATSLIYNFKYIQDMLNVESKKED